MTKMIWLKVILYAMAVFYLIGAFVHYFGLTLFPWFESILYSQYHDTIIALASFGFALIIFIVAGEPQQYTKIIYVISIVAVISGVTTIYMSNIVDWGSYQSVAKQSQAMVEGILLVILSPILFLLNSRRAY